MSGWPGAGAKAGNKSTNRYLGLLQEPLRIWDQHEYTEQLLNSPTLLVPSLNRLVTFADSKHHGQSIRPYSRIIFGRLITRSGTLRDTDATKLEYLMIDARHLTVSQLLVVAMHCASEYGNLIPSTDPRHENLKRLYSLVQEFLVEGILHQLLAHGLRGKDWENQYLNVHGPSIPVDLRRTDATCNKFFSDNEIRDHRQIKSLGWDLLRVMGCVELYKASFRLKEESLPRVFRCFAPGGTFKEHQIDFVLESSTKFSPASTVQDRGRADSQSSARPKKRATSVMCRKTSAVSNKDPIIQGIGLFVILSAVLSSEIAELPCKDEWSQAIRHSYPRMARQSPDSERALVATYEGGTSALSWSSDVIALVYYSTPPGTLNYEVLSTDVRSRAFRMELKNNIEDWRQRRSSSEVLRKAIEQPTGGAKYRSQSNSRDRVPDWAKRIQDSKGSTLGFSNLSTSDNQNLDTSSEISSVITKLPKVVPRVDCGISTNGSLPRSSATGTRNPQKGSGLSSREGVTQRDRQRSVDLPRAEDNRKLFPRTNGSPNTGNEKYNCHMTSNVSFHRRMSDSREQPSVRAQTMGPLPVPTRLRSSTAAERRSTIDEVRSIRSATLRQTVPTAKAEAEASGVLNRSKSNQEAVDRRRYQREKRDITQSHSGSRMTSLNSISPIPESPLDQFYKCLAPSRSRSNPTSVSDAAKEPDGRRNKLNSDMNRLRPPAMSSIKRQETDPMPLPRKRFNDNLIGKTPVSSRSRAI